MDLRAINAAIAGALRSDLASEDVLSRLGALFGAGWTDAADIAQAPADATGDLMMLAATRKAAGRRYLFTPPGQTLAVNDGGGNLFDVIHLGDGASYSGTTLLQPRSPFLGTRAVGGGVIPAAHLRRLRAVIAAHQTPTIVFIGDSIGAGADLINPMEGYAGRIMKRFRECNPGVQLRFVNRCIPGASWSKFDDGTPLSSVGSANWIINDYPSMTWHHAVAMESPAVVVALFGMNGHTAASVAAGVALCRTISPTPDIILGTNYLATAQDPSNTLGTLAVSMGARMSAAGSTRSAAAVLGCGLLDFHRQHCIAQFGYDPREVWLERVGANAVAALPFSTPQISADWAWRMTLPAGFLDAPFAIQIGADLRNLLVVERDAGGNIAVEGVLWGGVSSWLPRTVTPHAAPSGVSALELHLSDNMLRLWIPQSGSVVERVLYDGPALRAGGGQRMNIARYDRATGLTTSTAVPGLTLVYLLLGRNRAYTPYVTDNEIHGEDGQGGPIGGGNINHPTHLCHAQIAGPVLDSADLSGLM